MIARPTYYLEAFGLAADFDAVTREDVTKAYRAMAGNGAHSDHGGDPAKWQLITAAYNALREIFNKKRSKFETPSDAAWKRD